jgi:uncharacterized YigZ family protein
MGGPRRYRIPAARARVEDRIEHSRFITTLESARSADDAKAMIQGVRDEFPDATHHCFAYVIGPPGSTANTAASDDGEPSGTAGQPMLKVLINSSVGDVVVVVTRYFGGVKLGKGGLIRAFTGAVQHALRACVTKEHIDEVDVNVTLPYTAIDAVRRALGREGVAITNEVFGEIVTLVARVPVDRLEEIGQQLADATAGAARIER